MNNFNNDLYKKKYLKYKIKYIELKKQFGGTSKDDKTLYAIIRRQMDLNRVATNDDHERALPKMPVENPAAKPANSVVKPAENPGVKPAKKPPTCFYCGGSVTTRASIAWSEKNHLLHKHCKERMQIIKDHGYDTIRDSCKKVGGLFKGSCGECKKPVTDDHFRVRVDDTYYHVICP